jgi:hypothetical protein
MSAYFLALFATVVLALPAGAQVAAPEPCPTPYGQIIVDFSHVHMHDIRLRTVARASGRIYGTDEKTKRGIWVATCSGSQINEGRMDWSYLRPGDHVFSYEVADKTGRYVATQLWVNVIAIPVHIRHMSSASMDFIELDYHYSKPIRKKLSRDALPAHGTFDAKTRINDGIRSVAPARTYEGRNAKIFGYKRPDSAAVKVYLVELRPKKSG